MTNITAERLSEIAKLADSLHETYRVAAFTELIRHELNSSGGGDTNAKSGGGTTTTSESGDTPAWFGGVLAAVPEAHEIPARGRNAEVAWAAIQLFAQGESVHTASIQKIIKDELGTTPEAESNLSSRLGDLHPKYLRRDKDGRRYVYFPNVKTAELFESK